jgi:RecA/RadA recombinase
MVGDNMNEDILTGLLHGDLPKGKLILLYGPGGTDKTNLAILCAVNHAERGFKVLYIDADGSFSRMRLDHTITEHPEAVSKIYITQPLDFESQGKLIRNLDAYIAGVKLIIFDTVTLLYRAGLDGSSKAAFRRSHEMKLQLEKLHQTAEKYGVPILLTAAVHLNIDKGQVEPAAANLLRNWCDIIIFLTPNLQKRETTATLEKPNGEPSKITFKWLKYRLWLADKTT